ncbi:MAG: DNA internalization-related competence protein ComEC/Rec2 [Anaerolineae bacterium]
MILLYIGCAWTFGILLAARFDPSLSVLGALVPVPAAGLVRRRHHPQHRLLAACAIVALLGAARYVVAIPHFDAHHVARYTDTPDVVLEGVVASEPDVRDRSTNLRVAARRLQIDGAWRDVEGTVLVQAGRYPARQHGDVLRAAGDLETPPVFEDFSYRDYLARQGVYTMMRRPRIEQIGQGEGSPLLAGIYALKARAKTVIAAIFPEPEASLLAGILLGYERGIPKDVAEAFSRTNTTHIIAISGFNITILAGIFAAIAGRLLGRRRATPAVIAGIVLYTILVGANAAVVRAALMGILYVIAVHYGRQSDAVTSLVAAVVVMTLINPFTLWHVGFQLSFAATLGLILIVPPLTEAFEGGLGRFIERDRARTTVQLLNEALIVTLAAQVATLPIMVYYFHKVSAVGLLANFAILPAQPAVMILGGIATLAGLVVLPLGQVLAWVALPFPLYTIRVVEQMARLPYASVDLGRVSLSWVWGYYALLAGVVYVVHQNSEGRRALWRAVTDKLSTKAALAGLSLVAIVAWMGAAAAPDGRLHVVFLDVGQGDGIFITTPGGHQAIIDGGPSPAAMADAVGRRMPFWDRSIDLVIMTHANEDHVGGLIPVLERYRVDHAVEPGYAQSTAPYFRWRDLLREKKIDTHFARVDMWIDLGEGVWMEVLNPPQSLLQGTEADDNNNSVVVRLTYGEVAFLLTGDIEAEVEGRLAARSRVDAQVLKLAHHGSDSSTTPELLAAVQPWVAVISVGADNRFGHPSDEVLARVAQEGIPIYRTDEHGDVEFISDGRRLWVRTERKPAD